MTDVAVRRLFRVVNGGTPTSEETNWDGGVLWATPLDLAAIDGSSIVSTARTLTREGVISGSATVPQGSLVLSTRAPIGYVAATTAETGFNQGCRGLVPQVALDLRFFRYQLLGRRGELVCHGQGSTFTELSSHSLAAFKLRCPALEDQQRIADFLDAETARIDSLIEKKHIMIRLVQERESNLFHQALEARGFRWNPSLENPSAAGRSPPLGWRIGRLSTVLDQLTNGYVGPTRDLLVERGVKYIQSLHIKDGRIDFSRRPYYVPSGWHEQRPRIHLRTGDVLLVQTGDIGQVAVVPPGFGPASCHALLIARVRSEVITGDYLGAYLRSPFGRQSLLSRVTGALHPHLEGGIRDIPIVVPPREVQNGVVEQTRVRGDLTRRIRSKLIQQIELLREHRQALITAAVTGQLEIVSSASTRSRSSARSPSPDAHVPASIPSPR